MKNVLFVTDKWCDNNPSLSFSPTAHSFIKTLGESKSDIIIHAIHYDESKIIYGKDIDDVIIEYCKRWPQNAIFFCLGGPGPMIPTKKVFDAVQKFGAKTAAFWSDTGPSWGLETIKDFGDLIDLNISIDNPTSSLHDQYDDKGKHLLLWTPTDSSHFYPIKEKDIDVSFIGSARYTNRQYIINEIKKKIPNLFLGGGQREQNLTTEAYAKLIRRSKITINFSQSPALFWQTKGRVLEALKCETLLLESANYSTRSFFSPGIDYIEFNSLEDIIGKIEYFLSHDEERKRIAENGRKSLDANCSNKIFWDLIFSKLEL